MTREQRRADARMIILHVIGAVALAIIAVTATACGQTRPPVGDTARISDDQLRTMTRDHLMTLGGMALQ